MDDMRPSPQTTLAILLGASEWPHTNLSGSPAFARSAHKVREYFLYSNHLGVRPENWLDLFDRRQSSPDEVDQAIGTFLQERISLMKQAGTPARDLLFYYIGHGMFALGPDQAYHLAIRSTRKESLRASAIAMAALADTLKANARLLRRIVILDCCFAAESYRYMMSAPDQAALKQTIDAFEDKSTGSGFPQKGTALLCSSGQKEASLLLPDESGTMFSEALIHALALGNTRQQQKTHLSLYELKTVIEEVLENFPEGNAPRPFVSSPDQSDGDVATVPFFPNPRADDERKRKAEEAEQARKVEEKLAREAEEKRIRKVEEERVKAQLKEQARKAEEAEQARKAEEKLAREAEEKRIRKVEEERVKAQLKEQARKAEEKLAREAEEERTRLPVLARVKCNRGHENPASSAFCYECGEPLLFKCSRGHENPASSAFCYECGEPLLFEREQVRRAEEDQARSQPPYRYTAEGLSQSTGPLFDEDWDNTMISSSGFSPLQNGPLAQQYEHGSYTSNYPTQQPSTWDAPAQDPWGQSQANGFVFPSATPFVEETKEDKDFEPTQVGCLISFLAFHGIIAPIFMGILFQSWWIFVGVFLGQNILSFFLSLPAYGGTKDGKRLSSPLSILIALPSEITWSIVVWMNYANSHILWLTIFLILILLVNLVVPSSINKI